MQYVAIALVGFVVMEPLTALTHRYVMHGFGWVLHRSHHRRGSTGWEANDLYPVMFASAVLIGLAVGFNVPGFAALVPLGVGITLYGAAYALVHDVYIHRRLRLFGEHELPVFDRLAAAHRIHHARNGAPYGMLVPMVGRQRMSSSATRASAVPANGSRPSHEPVDA